MVTLKELREKAGYTQDKISDELGVTTNTIQYWEKNNNISKNDLRNKILELYGFKTPEERAQIIGQLGIIGYEDRGQVQSDYFPTFIYEEDSEEYHKIMNCWASSEELDMLAYAEYMRKGSIVYGSKRKEEVNSISMPMEFAFFEKYGGFNKTMHRLNEVRERLGNLLKDALEFALANPSTEYRLATMDKDIILDKIADFIHTNKNMKRCREIYDTLKSIGDEEILSVNGEYQMKNPGIKKIVMSYSANDNQSASYGDYDDYIVIDKKEDHTEFVRLNERGKKLIDWFEQN